MLVSEPYSDVALHSKLCWARETEETCGDERFEFLVGQGALARFKLDLTLVVSASFI